MGLFGISPESFHDHGDDHLCHVEHKNERVDSCHWSVHHGIEKCRDHDHLTENLHECALCDLAIGTTWLVQPSHQSESASLEFDTTTPDVIVSLLCQRADIGIHKRGPPNSSLSA